MDKSAQHIDTPVVPSPTAAAPDSPQAAVPFNSPEAREARKAARIHKRAVKARGKGIETIKASHAQLKTDVSPDNGKKSSNISSNRKRTPQPDPETAPSPWTVLTAEEYNVLNKPQDSHNDADTTITQPPDLKPGLTTPFNPQHSDSLTRTPVILVNNITDSLNNNKEELLDNTNIDDSNLFQDPETQKQFFEANPENGNGELRGDKSFIQLIEKYSKRNLSFILQTRQENLCRCIALGYDPSQACKITGYSPSNSAQTARNLYRSPIIHARVKQLLEGDFRGIEPTNPDLIMLKLQLIERKALSSDRLKEALECVKLQGMEMGMFLPKGKDSGTTKGVTVIITDSYQTDQDGKHTVSTQKIKQAIDTAIQVSEAEPAEIVEEQPQSTEVVDNPLAKLVDE